ncbi:complement resistance protein TraT [Paracidovorax konjaci]|uniref:Glycine zipper family protein n=1 Tax=Paracidovorax konjaci TaxID=32040 RepID=A0A1I1TNJ8_9BURK|nr:complement resistance protein TraT [Paracidovorax konjaci]SFD57050.1 hypothetical protein SAMN04489710_103315 [Paracidovorax konjaci]
MPLPHTGRRAPRPFRAAPTVAALALALAGCAAQGPRPGAAASMPADPAQHAADLDACQRYAQQIDVVMETLDGMVTGALVLASLAWSAGGSRGTVGGWAVAGGALGATQGLQPLERRRRAVENCMQSRGHAAGPYVAAPGYPVAQAIALPAEPPPRAPVPSIAVGTDTFSAERLARAQSCSVQPRAALAAKGPGFETYTVPCDSGDALAIRCEFGNCRVLR